MHLQAIFHILKKRCKVTLTEECITWVPEGSGCARRIPISEVVGVWVCACGSSRCKVRPHDTHAHTPASALVPPPPARIGSGGGLTLEYCERRGSRGRDGRGHKWTTNTVTLMHLAHEVITTWHNAVKNHIRGLRQRPRRLLVVINPVGGKKQASRIYRRKVMPLFRRAEIDARVVRTEYRGHAQKLVEDETNIDGVDGVVAVGGDGLVNEVVMGLVMVACRRAGLDPNHSDVILPSTHLRLGIIPCGSTDALCHSTHGTSSVVTAALHIIMGDSQRVDVASVHHDNQLESVATTMVSYGYFGDLLRTSERWRKLGPTRYLVSGVVQLFKNKFYEGQLRVRAPKTPLAQPYDVNVCTDKCSVCAKTSVCAPVPGEWMQFTGRWSIVTSAVTSCSCRLTPHGVSPVAHLGDGCADLVLVAGRSRCHTLSYLFRTAFTGNAVSLQHVTFHRAQEVVFTPKAGCAESSWNCDGELLKEPRLKLRVHCQRVSLFSRGIESPAADDTIKAPSPPSPSSSSSAVRSVAV